MNITDDSSMSSSSSQCNKTEKNFSKKILKRWLDVFKSVNFDQWRMLELSQWFINDNSSIVKYESYFYNF